MHILHICPSVDPATGGPGVVAFRLAAAQASLGHDVDLVSYATAGARERLEQAVARVPHGGLVRHHVLAPPTALERVFGRRACAAVARLLGKAQVAHLHGVWESLVRVAARETRRRRRAYFVRPCGMLDPWSLGQKRWKKAAALAFSYRRMINNAAALHLLNGDEARLIEPLRLTARRVVIPNGVFLEEIEPLPPAGTFYARHPELRGRPFVLFLSRLHYKKGLDYLVSAFALLAQVDPELNLVVAGPDYGARQPLERQVESAGLRDRVHVVGPLYGDLKSAALVDAACFCLPSRQEGFSLAILEALACRTPVVISKNCHFPEVAEAGAGEVVQLDARALADALRRVTADGTARQRMGGAGRQLVESRYTWSRVAQACVAAYGQYG
jgi:glycosyltransferase involved in cell wall biosynthesis